MKMRSIHGSVAIFSLAAMAACSRTTTGVSAGIPHLQKQGTATQLIVDGQGDYLDLRNQRLAGDPDRGIQRVTLYRYR